MSRANIRKCPLFFEKRASPSDLASLGHLKVNCPVGAREATLGCPRKRGRQEISDLHPLSAVFFGKDHKLKGYIL